MKQFLLAITISAFAVGSSIAQTQTVGVFTNTAEAMESYTLLTPNGSMTSYLINNCGEVINEWTSGYKPGLCSYLLEDGSMLRTAQIPSQATPAFTGGGTGGRVELFNWEGNVIWYIDWADDVLHQHHDVEYLPNGNILIIAWESHSYEDALAMGKNPTSSENPVWCCNVSEIHPTGNSGGEVVWSWSSWDHLVQDTDPSLPNYATISDEPRKFDINFTFGAGATNGAGASDWMHCNSIDYNEDLDQIILSSFKFSEFWIINHGLTTEEAATEQGDLLYRFGNPETYDMGTSDDRVLYHQHDAHWITDGPDAGKIMVFNNGKNRPDGEYSTVVVVDVPEFNGTTYPIESGQAFAPASYDWRYPENFDANFYAQNISGASRLPNGNTLVCEGPEGHIFEVNSNEEIVWDYICPATSYGPTTQGEDPGNNAVFRAYKYPLNYPAFEGRDLTASGVIELDSWDTGCELGVYSLGSSIEEFKAYPNPFINSTTIQANSEGRIDIYNVGGELIESFVSNKNETIRIGEAYLAGAYIVKHLGREGQIISSKLIIKQ